MSGSPQSDPTTWNRDLASLHPYADEDPNLPPGGGEPPPEEDDGKAKPLPDNLEEVPPPKSDEEVKELFGETKKVVTKNYGLDDNGDDDDTKHGKKHSKK